jgi:quinol-cytochrome oxidoreductase complex cytochrome b subunit
VRSARFRPVYRVVSWLLPIALISLGYVGSQPPEGWIVTLGQVATFYYYFHFLILLPVLGRVERPRPLPISIAAAVLGPRVAGATVASAAGGATESH